MVSKARLRTTEITQNHGGYLSITTSTILTQQDANGFTAMSRGGSLC